MPNVETQGDGMLFLRSYTLAKKTECHSFSQIAIPLNGRMDISIEGAAYRVGLGQAVIIRANNTHKYSAPDNSRFLVANMSDLPENVAGSTDALVEITPEMVNFCSYAETQLKNTSDETAGSLLYKLFFRLLELQTFVTRTDPRILLALQQIEDDLGASHSIESLAAAAHLSTSQFKTLFKDSLGQSTRDYITARRMEQAKTLLRNTDYPVSVVAIDVGYEDASAFSRRFRRHFDQSPIEFARGF